MVQRTCEQVRPSQGPRMIYMHIAALPRRNHIALASSQRGTPSTVSRILLPNVAPPTSPPVQRMCMETNSGVNDNLDCHSPKRRFYSVPTRLSHPNHLYVCARGALTAPHLPAPNLTMQYRCSKEMQHSVEPPSRVQYAVTAAGPALCFPNPHARFFISTEGATVASSFSE